MAEPPRYPESADEPPALPDVEPPPGTPLWVKVFGVIAVVVVLVFAILLLTGGHGPARHSSGGDRVQPVAFGLGMPAG
jgi:hypothetical protein